MRSRDGNHTFSLRLFSVIFCSSLALNASEFLISYSYTVKNAILYNETLQISKAMKKCNGTPQKAFIVTSNGEKDLQRILSKNSQEFINYIHTLGLHLKHQSQNSKTKNRSTTTLILKTRCFKVDFNDNFAKISPLK